ncbi:DUF4468 domain-containing protein [Rufibacter quisquiliarum]|uniref:DUF4468 domain-containing protein n=1 Tax=Rufibacter quisquiliarum TaxID=1549639 RepID=A0A839GHC9_9BACT|nr:DUF4468 domain-containing protein [Rufibacter quisquiliarum]MBA9076099.1 hypothetical protein [Rufibacter quisquiliarum]
MKKFIIFLLLVLPLEVFAQKYEYRGIKNFPVNAETGKVSYDSVVVAEGRTAEQLYNAAKEWLARSYGDAKEAIQVDQPNEKIVGKGILKDTDRTYLSYNFKMEFKAGRYRYEVTDFAYASTGLTLEEDTKSTKGNYKFYDRGYAALNRNIFQIALAFTEIGKAVPTKDW